MMKPNASTRTWGFPIWLRVWGLLSLLLMAPVRGHQDPIGETHPWVDIVEGTFVVMFWDGNPFGGGMEGGPSFFRPPLRRVYDEKGRLVRDREAVPDVERTVPVDTDSEIIDADTIPSIPASLRSSSDSERYWMWKPSYHVQRRARGVSYLVLSRAPPKAYLEIRDGKFVHAGAFQEGEVREAYGIVGSPRGVAVLGRSPSASVEWTANKRLTVFGRTLAFWERDYSRMFRDLDREFLRRPSGPLVDSITVRRISRDLCLFVFHPAHAARAQRIVLGQPAYIYTFPVCSGVVEYKDCYLVAWIDLQERLMLSRYDAAKRRLSSIVLEDQATWNTSISMACIGHHLLVAWHQGTGGYPELDSRIRTKHVDLEQQVWSKRHSLS